MNQDFEKAVFAVADVGGKAHLQVGNGMQRLIVGSAPFDVIEIDAYKIDGFFLLRYAPEPNLTTTTVINRFWLIAAVESRSEAKAAGVSQATVSRALNLSPETSPSPK